MKIKYIQKHRNGYNHPHWTVAVDDKADDLYKWLTQTFGAEQRTPASGLTPWERNWSGKQYHNMGNHQYQIRRQDIMTMLQLKWS